MEEIVSLLQKGCKLVQDIDTIPSNVPRHLNQPEALAALCEEIIITFTEIRQRLVAAPNYAILSKKVSPENQGSCGVNAESSRPDHQFQKPGVKGMGLPEGVVGPLRSPRTKGSSSSKPNKRNDDVLRRTVRVAAPAVGTNDIPPEDGFSWRKYGQKEILGATFPRSYYRCSNQRTNNCLAKKLVQRSESDPQTFEITYRGEHCCRTTASETTVTGGSWVGTRAAVTGVGDNILGPTDEPFTVDGILEAIWSSGNSSGSSLESIFLSDFTSV